MRSVKLKVRLSPADEVLFAGFSEELTWVWNKLLLLANINHSNDWYKWFYSQSNIEPEGVVEVPIFTKKNAWYGATCKIATGGGWFRDSNWVNGKEPYTQSCPLPYNMFQLDGEILNDVTRLDSMKRLNKLRSLEELPDLTIHSDYVGGLVRNSFKPAWMAFKGKEKNRKKPKFKRDKEVVSSFINVQVPPVFDFQTNTVKIKSKPGRGNESVLQIAEKDGYKQRLGFKKNVIGFWENSLKPCSYVLTHEPTGWYLCIAIADKLDIDKQDKLNSLNEELKGINKSIKTSTEDKLAELENRKAELKELLKTVKASNPSRGKQAKDINCVIQPGVKEAAVLDNNTVFQANKSRDKHDNKVSVLQRKLALLEAKNDKQTGRKLSKGQRERTNGELKLIQQIARTHEKARNSSKSFNHKLSTRLARTYRSITWKNNTPKLVSEEDLDDNKYANRNIKNSCLGQLREMTRQKVIDRGGEFVEG